VPGTLGTVLSAGFRNRGGCARNFALQPLQQK
jgi:hypothetical protein